MGVYDEEYENRKNPLSPEELSNQEQQPDTGYDDAQSGDDSGIRGTAADPGKKVRFNPHKAEREKEAAEQAALDDKLGGIKDRVGSGSAGGGFYRNDDKKGFGGKKGSSKAAGGGMLKNRKMLLGVGGGVVGSVFAFMAFFNLLHTFQTDHLFKNIETKTASRLNASLDSRNRSLTQAYMKIRATEIQGGTANDNLYFKADKIKTGNPMRDWYATMRASKFETELLNKQGIYFTSMVDENGRISVAKISSNDPEAFKALTKDGPVTDKNFAEKLNKLSGQDMEKLFTVQSFDSHKSARKSVKEVVNAEVPWKNSFKRRALRKDIANKTGIKKWRLFESTRDKIAKNKQDIKDRLMNKIIDRYYLNNPSGAQFMKCLFSNGRCSTTSDPASPDNHAIDPAQGKAPAEDLAEADKNPDTVADGKKVDGTTLNTGEVGNDVDKAVKTEITQGLTAEASKEADQAVTKLSIRQKLIISVIRSVTGGTVSDAIPFSPTKFWTYAKRIAKVHTLLGSSAGAGKLATMVMNARSSQLQGIYSTYAIANDQMKSGQLTDGELNAFFDTTKNIGNSEGWGVVTGQIKPNGVSAASTTNLSKEEYCKPDHVKTETEFAWMCDDQKPNGGGNAQTISTTYNQTVGPVVAPIAEGVAKVQDSPLGTVTDWVNEKIDGVVSKITDPLVGKIMNETGLGKTLSDYMGVAMSKMFEFLGAGPMLAGNNPGIGNLLVAGGASLAEDSTRSSGGIRSTPQSLAYSNNLAAEYQKENTAKQSVMERYASLDNPDSLASSSLFTLSTNLSISRLASRIGSYVTALPATMGSVFSGQAFADNRSASTVANWSGVNTYDIPQACLDLDPLDPDYLSKSSNVSSIGLSPTTLGFETMRDTNKFWKAVYDKLGNDPEAQTKAEKIYDCALFDARAMGSVGYVYGYNKDGGYTDSAPPTTGQTTTMASSNPNIYILGDSLTVGMSSDGKLEDKLKAKKWQNISISAECGRHLKMDGVYCGTAKPTFPGGFKQADEDKDKIARAGTVVIGLGTNDAGDPGFSENVSAMVDKVRSFNPNAKIYWINLYSSDGSGPKFPAMNEILNDLAKTKNFTIIDWAGVAPPNYSPGNLHPNGKYGNMAETVVNTVGEPAASAPGTPGSGDTGDGIVKGDAVKTALGLAWDTKQDQGKIKKSDAKPSFQAAMPKYNGSTAATSWSDCGVFISTVMRASGVDPNYPIQGTTVMLPYLRNHPEKYTIITEDATSASQLQPGDIIINDHHTMLFVGQQPGGYDTVDSSFNDRVPGAKIFAPYAGTDRSGRITWMVARPKK